MVDEFIIYDNVQYTKNDWRNRNLIKTKQGLQWLSIPVQQIHLAQLIQDTEVTNQIWRKKHWKSLLQNYSKTRYFNTYKEVFEALYLDSNEISLSKINFSFIKVIANILDIDTNISFSNNFTSITGQTEQLLHICEQTNANVYISGPSAKDYFNLELAQKKNIHVEWMDYTGYNEYQQMHPPFEHTVSILDLLFNEGPNAIKYMKSFN